MALQALSTTKFIRRTQLNSNEYRKNFRQLDCDVIEVLTSPEATKVTGLMSKIYLRLVNAASDFFEREGVLHFTSEVRGDKTVTAWEILCETVGVAGGTASKAFRWMSEQGLIGYFAAKNGVGIRIFLNRAAASIGVRPSAQRAASVGQGSGNVVAFPATAKREAPASSLAATFIEESLEKLDSDNSSATREATNDSSIEPTKMTPDSSKEKLQECHSSLSVSTHNEAVNTLNLQTHRPDALEAKFLQLLRETEARLLKATERAVAESVSREQQRTREWFENRALPKAIRVAQHESYAVWRQQKNSIPEQEQRAQTAARVGKWDTESSDERLATGQPCRQKDILELAETCLWLRETQGREIEEILVSLKTGEDARLEAAQEAELRDYIGLLQAGTLVPANPFSLEQGKTKSAMARTGTL